MLNVKCLCSTGRIFECRCPFWARARRNNNQSLWNHNNLSTYKILHQRIRMFHVRAMPDAYTTSRQPTHTHTHTHTLQTQHFPTLRATLLVMSWGHVMGNVMGPRYGLHYVHVMGGFAARTIFKHHNSCSKSSLKMDIHLFAPNASNCPPKNYSNRERVHVDSSHWGGARQPRFGVLNLGKSLYQSLCVSTEIMFDHRHLHEEGTFAR